MSYRIVNERFWRDPKVQNLEPKEKLLFLYFITTADAHYSGIYYCPVQIIQLETGLTNKEILNFIDTLSLGYMIDYDKGTNEVFVRNMAKFQVVSSTQVKGVAKHFKETVQSKALIKSFLNIYNTLSIPYQYPTDTTETETERETDIEKEKIYKKEKVNQTELPGLQKTDDLKPEEVCEDVWSDFKKHRKEKKAALTKTALDSIFKEAEKVGYSKEEALIEIMARGWQGFKAEWIRNSGKKQGKVLRNGQYKADKGYKPRVKI